MKEPKISGEPVAWRVRVTDNGRTMYVYTERLPFEPSADSGVKVRSEPEPLYLHSAPTCVRGCPPWEIPCRIGCEHVRTRREKEGSAPADTAVAWAVERWNAEVKNRPLQNIHRAALDTTWRQVIRYFGGDPDALLSLPPHHDLTSKSGAGNEPDPAPTRGEVLEEPDMLIEGRKYEDDRKPDLIIRGEPFYSGAQFRAAFRHGYDFARALAGEKP